MNDLERLARQLPVHKLRMTPWDYLRYFPRAFGTVLWEIGMKVLKQKLVKTIEK